MTIDYYDATATYVPSEAQRFCVESWNEDTGVERERLQGEEFLTRRQAWRLARHLRLGLLTGDYPGAIALQSQRQGQ